MASLANVLRNTIGHAGKSFICTNSSHGAHGGTEGHVFMVTHGLAPSITGWGFFITTNPAPLPTPNFTSGPGLDRTFRLASHLATKICIPVHTAKNFIICIPGKGTLWAGVSR